MCGIFGSTHTYELSDWDVKQLGHRGPDGSGVWLDKNVGILLGHCRLSVVDTSSNGAQPMHSKKGSVITYNGEIYNFLQVKKNLQDLGYIFRSTSDTEVLLYAIDEWGIEQAVAKFAGMFAFGFWDVSQNKLFLARDRVGVKPLYYAILSDRLLFASELKPIMRHPAFCKKINMNALYLYTKYRYIPAPQTIFHNVYKLPPATILELSPQHFPNVKTFCYWSYKNILNNNIDHPVSNEAEAMESMETSLVDVVKEHLIADVPIGAFLSGGIDSSAIVAFIQKKLECKVKTFTIGFPDIGYNETLTARKISQFLGTDHTEVLLSPDEALKEIPLLAKSYDEPFADSSQIPTLLVSKVARQQVTVALSGDGGDEILGGYNRYIIASKMWKYANFFPRWSRQNVGALLQAIPEKIWDTHLLQRIARLKPEEKIQKIAHLLMAKNNVDVYRKLTTCWNNGNVVTGFEQEMNIDFFFENFTTNMMYNDFMSYLPDDVLTKVDRASMCYSLEVRVPFLDHRIIEEAARIPLSMKIKNGKGKHILREILYKYVPRTMFDTTKMGFAIPLHDWLRGPLKKWAEELLDEKAIEQENFFCAKMVTKKWREHLEGKRNWQDDIWIILMFQLWKQEYL